MIMEFCQNFRVFFLAKHRNKIKIIFVALTFLFVVFAYEFSL